MSGGHFQYQQFQISQIADKIEQLIFYNDSDERDKYGDIKGKCYASETIAEFKKAVKTLRAAYVYAQRIDWLVSCDDGEESFHRRLQDELKKVES
jgi:hypothetical protein